MHQQASSRPCMQSTRFCGHFVHIIYNLARLAASHPRYLTVFSAQPPKSGRLICFSCDQRRGAPKKRSPPTIHPSHPRSWPGPQIVAVSQCGVQPYRHLAELTHAKRLGKHWAGGVPAVQGARTKSKDHPEGQVLSKTRTTVLPEAWASDEEPHALSQERLGTRH